MQRSLVTSVLSAILVAAALFSCAPIGGGSGRQGKLAPGRYEWHPERSPKGPVLMVVSIDDQTAYLYRNGVQIARSTVSTGRPGKETPTGVFTVLQRKVEHESTIYEGAQMPYMQRLTWSGIAMHAGDLPGYPASGGCIRLPYDFSQKVYGVMGMGATVVITRKNSQPAKSARPADVLLASRAANTGDKAIPDPKGMVTWTPSKSRSGPFSVLISYADRTAYVWRNGILIGKSPIQIAAGANPPEGVFMRLEGTERPDSRFPGETMHPWSVLSLNGGNAGGNAVEAIRSQVRFPRNFRENLSSALTPGTILVATRQSSNASTRSARDFTIVAPEAEPR